jgi:hypothetical protein
MTHSLRRLAVGAALAGAAFAAAPALASASSTCSYTPSARYVYIEDGSGSSTLHVSRTRGGLITYADGNGQPSQCFDKNNPASVNTADTIYIQGPAVGKYDTIEYDESNGLFTPTTSTTGKSKIKLYSMSTSSELYALSVRGTSSNDTFRVGGKGAIDLDADGIVDVDETYGASAVELHGGDGADLLDGHGFGQVGPATVPEYMYGGDDPDTFYAGREHNYVYGEGGDDDMLLNANGYPDSFEGGEGADRAWLDTFDIGDAEQRFFPGH